MVKLNKFWYLVIALVVLGAVFIDTYSYTYRYFVAHVPPGKPLKTVPNIGGHPITIEKGLDLQGGTELTIAICEGYDKPAGTTCRSGVPGGLKNLAKAQAATVTILGERVNGLGIAQASVQAQGTDEVVVQIPGVTIQRAIQVVGTTAQLHFATAVAGAPNPKNPAFLADQEGLYDPAQFNNPAFYPVLSGSRFHWKIDRALPATDVTSASVVFDSTTNAYAVSISFNSAGAAQWAKLTSQAFKANAGCPTTVIPQNQVAIFLDTKVITAPCVESVSSSQTQISPFTQSQATLLADQISAGALPAQISTVASTEVSATLGAASVKESLVAGAVGLAIVVLFMLLYYGFSGLLAAIALAIYAAIVLAVFELVPITLSLAGLAGFVLSVGMAVDANVLIFERMRDELRHGRSLPLAIETGFRRAFPAIRDSNFSTLIACLILVRFGTSVIQGFAITLGIGVIASFFTATVISQALFHFAIKIRPLRNPRLYARLAKTPELAGDADESALAGGSAAGTAVPDGGVLVQAPAMSSSAEAAVAEYERMVGGRGPRQGRNRTFDIIAPRNVYFLVSLLIILAGLAAILGWGFRLGIDFAGGNTVTATLVKPASQAQVLATADRTIGALQPQVVKSTGNVFTIQTLPSSIDRVTSLITALQDKYGIVHPPHQPQHPDVQVSTVGPTIASSLVQDAVELILVASLFIALYLAFVFGSQTAVSRVRFSVATFIKLLHDVFVLLGIWAILGHFSSIGSVGTLFVTAVLTSIAFSIHDTIVVFDRIRENLRFGPRLTFEQVVNLSTAQTMTRSLNTSLTVVFVLLSLVLFGGSTIQGFVLALLIGVVTGTYSSIFNASTMLVAWDYIWPGKAARAARLAAVRGVRAQ